MRVYKAIKVIFTIFLFFGIVITMLTSTVLVGGVMVKKKIEDFKSRGEYVGTYDVNFFGHKIVEFYEVKKEYDYEY